MSELGPKDRLQEAIRRLDEWEGKLPGFGAFHTRRSAVLDRLRDQSGSFLKLAFAKSSDLLELAQQANSVDQLGAGLDELFQKLSQLQSEIHELKPLLRAQDSGPFAAAVEQRHQDWLGQIEPLGRDIARSSELKTPRTIVQNFHHLVPRDKIALELLAEATAMLSEVEQDVGRVGLQGDIQRWRDEFLRSGAPHHWAEQVRQELDGYRQKREEQDRRQQNQPGRKELAAIEREAIPLATYWAQVLDDSRSAVPPVSDDPAPLDAVKRISKFRERIRQGLSPGGSPAEAAEEVGREVSELLDALSAAAEVRARTAVLQLERRLELFCGACSTTPERNEQIGALLVTIRQLNGREAARPEDFDGIAESLGGAKTEFEGLAANQRGRLSVAAKKALAECAESAAKLLDNVHPQSVLVALRARQAEIPAEPPGEPQAQESLRLLEVCHGIRTDFARLSTESAAALEAFQSERREATELAAGAGAVIEALGARPASELADAAEALAGLESPPPGVALEESERKVAGAQAIIRSALDQARLEAQSTLDERSRFCLEAGRALQAIKRIPPAAPEGPSSLDGLAPHAVRELLDSSQAAETVFRAELERAAAALRQQTEESAAGLQAFIDGVADSGDSKRHWAQELLDDLADTVWDLADTAWLDGLDPAGQVLDAARWLEGHHTFQEDLQRNETRARELREKLRTLQLEIQKDSRHRYNPDLFERAKRLLEGVPAEPTDWQQAVSQLDEAEHWLRLADDEARRRIALELRETREALTEAARRTADPAVRRDIEAKLAKLDEHPPAETPPNAVRRPLIYQARQLGVGGLRGRR